MTPMTLAEVYERARLFLAGGWIRYQYDPAAIVEANELRHALRQSPCPTTTKRLRRVLFRFDFSREPSALAERNRISTALHFAEKKAASEAISGEVAVPKAIHVGSVMIGALPSKVSIFGAEGGSADAASTAIDAAATLPPSPKPTVPREPFSLTVDYTRFKPAMTREPFSLTVDYTRFKPVMTREQAIEAVAKGGAQAPMAHGR